MTPAAPDPPAEPAAPEPEPAESLVVARRRGRVAPVVALVLALLGAALLALADSPAERVVGGAGAAVFGLSAGLLQLRNRRPAPALVLDGRGFTDTGSGAAAGFVPWSAVTGLVEQRVRGQRHLSVLVAEPAEILARADDGARAAMRANLVLLGTPVNLPLRVLDLGVEELTRAFARHTPAAVPAALAARLPAGTAPRPPADEAARADLSARAAAAGIALPAPYLDLLAHQDGWTGPDGRRVFGSRPVRDLDGVVEATLNGRSEGLPTGHVVLGGDDARRYTWHTSSTKFHVLARSDHKSLRQTSTLSDLIVAVLEDFGHPLG